MTAIAGANGDGASRPPPPPPTTTTSEARAPSVRVPREPLERLTPMERACLNLVAQRLSSKEIAAALGIAKTSVDTYCNRARSKLGVSDRYEAARLLARRAEPPPMPAPERPPLVAPASTRQATALRATNMRLLLIIGAALLTVLALGSLISGLDALEAMEAGLDAPVAALVKSPAPTTGMRTT